MGKEAKINAEEKMVEPQPQQVQLNQIPTERLKAAAFDMIVQRDQLTANINAITNELMARAQKTEPATKA